ncbi:YnhF family membrane protein [Vibrio sp.]
MEFELKFSLLLTAIVFMVLIGFGLIAIS